MNTDIRQAVHRIIKDGYTWKEIEDMFEPQTLGELLLRNDFHGTRQLILDGIHEMRRYQEYEAAQLRAAIKREELYRALKLRIYEI